MIKLVEHLGTKYVLENQVPYLRQLLTLPDVVDIADARFVPSAATELLVYLRQHGKLIDSQDPYRAELIRESEHRAREQKYALLASLPSIDALDSFVESLNPAYAYEVQDVSQIPLAVYILVTRPEIPICIDRVVPEVFDFIGAVRDSSVQYDSLYVIIEDYFYYSAKVENGKVHTFFDGDIDYDLFVQRYETIPQDLTAIPGLGEYCKLQIKDAFKQTAVSLRDYINVRWDYNDT